MAETPPIDWLALARVLDGTADPDTLTGETAIELERVRATGPVEDADPDDTTADDAADAFHAEVNQYIADVAADLEAKGIDPNSPESHDYFLAIAELRPTP